MAAKKWSSGEMLHALEIWLRGDGLRAVAEGISRSPGAVENVLMSDLPRNYRKCIAWIEDTPETRVRRQKTEWHFIEEQYLVTLRQHVRTNEEIELILGRPWKEIEKKLRSWLPIRRKPDEGFFKPEVLE